MHIYLITYNYSHLFLIKKRRFYVSENKRS
nr:MAG TPA: hypothetical protein [Bacteriophage sp.]